jgi:hypothetical protein
MRVIFTPGGPATDFDDLVVSPDIMVALRALIPAQSDEFTLAAITQVAGANICVSTAVPRGSVVLRRGGYVVAIIHVSGEESQDGSAH